MVLVYFIIDYIASLLASNRFQTNFFITCYSGNFFLFIEKPLEFDNEKYLYIKLLSDLKSLEKDRKTIITIQKWMLNTKIIKKYYGADFEKSDSKFIDSINLK